MSESEWDALEVGDIVIERASRTPRIVMHIHRSPRGWHTIEVVKIRRSRYCCPTTSLDKYIWRTRLDVAFGRRARVRNEWFYCEAHGWGHLPENKGRPCWTDPAHQVGRHERAWRKREGITPCNETVPPAPTRVYR